MSIILVSGVRGGSDGNDNIAQYMIKSQDKISAELQNVTEMADIFM